jgi:soluble lytic murein transglycosylase
MLFTTILTPLALALTVGLAAGLITPTTAHAQSGSATAVADAAVVEMGQAFRKGDRKRLTQLLPQAQGHVLQPWAAYWELKARLDDASPQEVQDFLARHAGSYVEDRLRNDWLLLLGRRRDWSLFAAEYPAYRMRDDREVRCYSLLVHHLRTGEDVSAEVRRLWHAQRDADDGCQHAADRLVSARLLKPADVWRKARLAMDANRPRAARAAVDLVAPDLSDLVSEVHARPQRYLDNRKLTVRTKRQELGLLALLSLARDDPDQAAQRLEQRWGPLLTEEERNWAWGAIGRQAAQRLSDQAMPYFDNVSRDRDLTDDMLAWKTRAALRQGRWPVVLSAINAMSDEARADPTWTYWKARALLGGLAPSARQALLQPVAAPTSPSASAATDSAPHGTSAASRRAHEAAAEARSLLAGMASGRGFYEQLALEELGQRIEVPPPPPPLSAEEKAAARRNPGLQRALAAIALGLRQDGVREWNYTTNLHQSGGMSDRDLLAAADLACEREVWDRCINTSERTRTVVDVTQRFPMPFRDAVVRRAREISLDPAYVYGLIRQESRFIMDARSHVGASGLMQVMPATARWTARKIGMTGFTAEQITDRDTNIAIGTAYLKLVLDDFGGSMPLAAAAYNAGPSRPRAWRNGPVLEAAIWAENVPFSETRDYVKKVLANTTNYAAILSGQGQSLRARLGTVGPRDNAATAENRDLP